MQEYHVLYCIAWYKKIAVDLHLVMALTVFMALLYKSPIKTTITLWLFKKLRHTHFFMIKGTKFETSCPSYTTIMILSLWLSMNHWNWPNATGLRLLPQLHTKGISTCWAINLTHCLLTPDLYLRQSVLNDENLILPSCILCVHCPLAASERLLSFPSDHNIQPMISS